MAFYSHNLYTVKTEVEISPSAVLKVTLYTITIIVDLHVVVSTPPKAYSNHSLSVYLHSPPPFRWYLVGM